MRTKLECRMARLKIRRSESLAFGRPTIEGVPVRVIAERFSAGEDIGELAADYELGADDILNAIRFVLIYPGCDAPGFWRRG